MEHVFLGIDSFSEKGGWVIDQQSISQIGSPYLMAHGLGEPVKDARSKFSIKTPGQYRVWVRTRNWTKLWYAGETPGKFQLLINTNLLPVIFGTEESYWHWQDGGIIYLEAGTHELLLHDLTGFNGRCNAVCLTTDLESAPPNEKNELEAFKRNYCGYYQNECTLEYDFVVAGGGVAGIAAAVAAARGGLRVALIQDRPVLGGNNSSEVRVGLSGKIHLPPYPELGNLIDEFGPIGYWSIWDANKNPDLARSKYVMDVVNKNPEKRIHNAGNHKNYEDQKKKVYVENEKNISLFLNMHVIEAKMEGDYIDSIKAYDFLTGEHIVFKARYFADCTGDANLGYVAGAEFRMGRESKHETQEESAPEKEDNLVMGTSVQWNTINRNEKSDFPDCPWAVQFTEFTCRYKIRGDWNWETGFYRDQISEIEYIRDYALRVVFGNWSFIKNQGIKKEMYANYALDWIAYIGGKRESRRLMGDLVLTENDIVRKVQYNDASFTTSWSIDLHYPVVCEDFPEEPFISRAVQKKIEPYPVPYRCLYSRNIKNLFMAGRNISVSHIALGTVRVMRTTSMMGEVIGMAVTLCKKYGVDHRDIYERYLDDLRDILRVGITKKK